MCSLKSLIRRLAPRKILYLRLIIRDGLLGKYLAEVKQFRTDRGLGPSCFPLYLSVVAIVKNEVPYIAEWIEYHLLVGVQKFFIYDNESTDRLREALEPYIRDGIVEYTFFPGIRRQVVVYNDALKRHQYASFWLAFIDVDEFLVPAAAENLPLFLRDFEDVPGIEVNQVLYGSGGQTKKTGGLVMERFRDHAPLDHFENRMVKTIVNPRRAFYMATAHVANYFDGEYSVDTHGNKNTEAANDRPAFHDRLRYNHYFCKSLEEFTEKSGRGRPSSPGKLSVDDFHRRDHNELKNDPIMDKYIPAVQERLKQRFGS